MSLPPAFTPWPMPGISKYVHPSTRAKKSIASAGRGVSMLIQQNSPTFRKLAAMVASLSKHGFG